MGQTKFDRELEETAESVAVGIGRVLAGRDTDGVRRTDATLWRPGTRVLPKAEAPVRHSAYRPGWQRLALRLVLGAGAVEAGYLLGRNPDTTVETVRELWADQDQILAMLEAGGIGAASTAVVGGAVYGLATRGRREFLREWVIPLHEGSPCRWVCRS
ncbi:hypothetical protein ABT354_23290 [Streptomyces sp. NPDC000594]|uniref:hypothetical protein n=1 Tax=Streptomyces sp. NPDC000594 TaxID=3154261 RepID=UPI00332D0A24